MGAASPSWRSSSQPLRKVVVLSLPRSRRLLDALLRWPWYHLMSDDRRRTEQEQNAPMVDQAFRSGVDLNHGPSLTGTHFSPTCGDAYAQRKRERDRMFEVLLPLVPGTVLGAWTLVERCAEVSGRSAPWR